MSLNKAVSEVCILLCSSSVTDGSLAIVARIYLTLCSVVLIGLSISADVSLVVSQAVLYLAGKARCGRPGRCVC